MSLYFNLKEQRSPPACFLNKKKPTHVVSIDLFSFIDISTRSEENEKKDTASNIQADTVAFFFQMIIITC